MSTLFRMDMDDNRWSIFQSAVDLFAASSYYTVPVKDIARNAGYQPGTFYNYFKSKDEMLQTIYRYHTEFFCRITPDLNEILDQVPTEHPYQLLDKILMLSYPQGTEVLMQKITRIIVSQQFSDPRAQRILEETLVIQPRNVRPILEKMVACGQVKPFDMDSFILIYSSLCYYGLVNHLTRHDVTLADRDRAVRCLYMMIQVVGD